MGFSDLLCHQSNLDTQRAVSSVSRHITCGEIVRTHVMARKSQ